MVHRAALISVSIALSQTPAKTASKFMNTGLVCRVVCPFSSQLTPVPIYTAWWTEAHVCEQLATTLSEDYRKSRGWFSRRFGKRERLRDKTSIIFWVWSRCGSKLLSITQLDTNQSMTFCDVIFSNFEGDAERIPIRLQLSMEMDV